MISYNTVIDDVFDAATFHLSDIKPADWAEANRFMTSNVSRKQGMFSYDNSPYTREIVDCLDPNHPSKVITVMKGAQIGFSTSVIENGIGYIISQHPGNILFLVGHEGLVKDAVKKVDIMLDNTGLRTYIQSQVNRSKNNKSGDTDDKKEFSGGELRIGIANHGELRNISMRYGFIDDFERMKGSDKKSGSTTAMIEQRFATYKDNMKLFYISTPELLEISNIYPMYLKGDQRKYNIPCPCCSQYIPIEWTIDSECNPGQSAGITWELDGNNRVVMGSVKYRCQKCDGVFDDRKKSEWLLFGKWVPTATDTALPGHYSYHISALYAPPYMYGWEHYVNTYLEANPIGGRRDENLHQTFTNLCLGLPYAPEGVTISADTLQRNIRQYSIGTVPEKMSISDGNGRIILLTLGADLNGIEEDARLDWEIQGWSESGASYSIDHGSIGTFVPKEPEEARQKRQGKRTYQHGSGNSVWPEFQEILNRLIPVDTGRKMPVFASALDTGYQTDYAYQFIDHSPSTIYGVKGDKLQGSGIHPDADYRPFKPALERGKLWILNVNYLKDIIATHMNLKWDPDISSVQPSGFMNFPTPSPDEGKYLLKNYFSHFEAEHKVTNKDNRFVWKKKDDSKQNHQFDCRIYGYASRDILLHQIFAELKIKNGVWADFVKLISDKS